MEAEIMEDKVTERKVMTVSEAADALGICRSKAYEAARAGEIPTVKIGTRVLVPIAALDKLLEGLK